jgi:hypothetical protein
MMEIRKGNWKKGEKEGIQEAKRWKSRKKKNIAREK